MANFHIKSIVLGIGIGIVLTGILSIIYLAGDKTAYNNLTKVQIIEEAKKLGMVMKTENNVFDKSSASNGNVFKLNSDAKSDKEKEQESKNQKSSENKADDSSKNTEEIEKVKIIIESGDTSEIVAEKLEKSGLISKSQIFVDKLNEMRLSTRIKIGEFEIEKGADLETIIRKITRS